MSTPEEYRKRFQNPYFEPSFTTAAGNGGGGGNLPPDIQARWDKVNAKMAQPGFAPQTAAGTGVGNHWGQDRVQYLGPPVQQPPGDTATNGRATDWPGWNPMPIGTDRPPWGYAPQQMGPTSIYDVFNSAVPLMNANRDRQIGQAMAQAGTQGTRFGTAALNNAARIGADTALQQDQMLTNLLYQQGQTDADRALQASGQAMNLANIYDQMQQNRINTLAGLGMWEQGRGDQLAMHPYNDWMQSRMGYLPYVMSAMSGVGMPQQQQPITTTTPGSPGIWDYLLQGGSLAAMMYGAGMFSDERLKKDIRRFPVEVVPGVPLAAWRWKHNNEAAAGVIAQDLEKVRPELVMDVAGYKLVNYGGLRWDNSPVD